MNRVNLESRVSPSGEASRADEVARRLGAMFTESALPCVALDPEGAIVAANDAMRVFFTPPPQVPRQILGQALRDLFAPPFRRGGGAGGEEGPAGSLEYLRRQDGSLVPVVRTESQIGAGEEKLRLVQLTEVTSLVERHAEPAVNAEFALRDQELVLNTAVALLGQPELVPALRILARAFADALGRSSSVWLPESDGSMRLRVVAVHALTVEGQSAIHHVRMDLEKERFSAMAWREGTAYVVRQALAAPGSVEEQTTGGLNADFVVSPLLGRSGPHGLIYAMIRPGLEEARVLALATTLGTLGGMIFEAVQLEARAKDEAARMQLVWQAASERLSDGIALLDDRLQVVRVNTAQRTLLGKEEHELVGRPCREVFEGCRSAGGRCPHREALEERKRIVFERVDPNTGRPTRNEVIPAPSEKSSLAVVHVTHDLTEERAIRSQLITTDRLASIGRLAAGVAHEINNPAAFVTVNLGVLRERFLAGTTRATDVLSMLDESLQGMERVREIVRDLKGFARERGVEDVDLAQVVQSALRMATHETRGRARVERISTDGASARVKSARIAQVVLNLVINAAQAIPAGRASEHRIVVRTYRQGEQAYVEVADTGPGVPQNLRERIFEPFFTTRERTGGTGLGLWLARGIVEDAGGTLTLREDPGYGACFVMALPASSLEAAPLPAREAREVPHGSGDRA